jgi:aromatic-L-amino-acid decarboxylase
MSNARDDGFDAAGFHDDALAAVAWVERYLAQVPELPVLPAVQPGDVRAQLPASPPERGEPFSALLADLDSVILPGITHWNHPRFFAYFAITGSPPGILAELLSAALNVNAMTWRTSPAGTELEELVLDWLAQLLGLPAGLHGHIEDTASTSTLAALAAARTLRPGGAVYASEHANFSVEKAARLLGLEYRTVPVDGEYRLRADLVDYDAATAVVATVGTTATTSVDPVAALADGCERSGAWLHVDAAYAGSGWVCPELRWSLDGCDRADSVVVNPHKGLHTPIDCSTLWTRRPEALAAAFSARPAYLRPSEGALDLKDYGPALGRRFRALKLWAVLRMLGREGLQASIREHVRLAQLFAGWVRDEPGWEVCAPHPFSVVCFRHTAGDAASEAIVERVNASGVAFLAGTTLDGRFAIRLAVGHARTTESDLQLTWDALRAAAETTLGRG